MAMHVPLPKPFFSKMVTNSESKNKLSMETKSLESFPPFTEGRRAQNIKMEDENGMEWVFPLTIRAGKYKKPVLSARGWRKFVKDKNVQAGFKVGFFKVEDGVKGEVKYKIRVAPPVRVFKAVFGHAPFTPGG